jgi:hypothetical protein
MKGASEVIGVVMKRRRAQPGDVYGVPLDDGTFTACQVLRQWPPRGLEVMEFDWIGPGPPTVDELEAAAPLRPRLSVEVSDPLPPRRFAWLGSTDPLAPVPDPRPSWLNDWERGIGREVGLLPRGLNPVLVDALKRAEEAKREHWDQRVEVALDGEPQQVSLASTELNVYDGILREFDEPDTGVRLVVRAGARLDWAQLDRLDGLHTIRYRGGDSRFGEYLRRRWLLSKAVWLDHDESRIDLGTTSIDRFRVEVSSQGLRLKLPETMEDLAIDTRAGCGPLVVSHFLHGAGLLVTLRGVTLPLTSGLERLTRLDIVLGGPTLDLTTLPHFADLEVLRAWGRGGSLVGLEALAAFPRLRTVFFSEFLDFDPESFPPPDTWSELDTVEFHRLSKESAVRLRARLRDVYRLRISGTRSTEWIEATRDNPFRNWTDRDARIAERACRAFATAERAIGDLGPDPAPEDIGPILKRFVQAFNRIARAGFIETLERDEV